VQQEFKISRESVILFFFHSVPSAPQEPTLSAVPGSPSELMSRHNWVANHKMFRQQVWTLKGFNTLCPNILWFATQLCLLPEAKFRGLGI